ncbi:hypothetical protein [Burkholderia pseudomallei]|uniref:hypothetical protein n=1 Tax=Burkholderia pseudomallei TaxID=28450 RepID=UPI00100C28D7|nr:hypothetical protein [Burkholderia pseudomallei]
MDSVKCKELIIGCIRYHFEGALQEVKDAGGASGNAPPAIENIKSSLVSAASGVEARVYDDYELSSKLLEPGTDLAYRSVIVSDMQRDDEWVAVLAVGLSELDGHSRKVALSYMPKSDGRRVTPQRLLVFITCAGRKVTMNPRFVIVSEGRTSLLHFHRAFFSGLSPSPTASSQSWDTLRRVNWHRSFWIGQLSCFPSSIAHTPLDCTMTMCVGCPRERCNKREASDDHAIMLNGSRAGISPA